MDGGKNSVQLGNFLITGKKEDRGSSYVLVLR
jgi:hypothetical protein